MLIRLSIPTFSIILFSACTTLNMQEINNIQKAEFSPLEIVPDYELNDLRIDIERQQYDVVIDECTTNTENVAYHQLGFNLGNGLYYDLNGNLSFRVDKLLNINPRLPFKIYSNRGFENKRRIQNKTFANDTLWLSRSKDSKPKYNYHIIDLFDSLVYMKNTRPRFTMGISDSTLFYYKRMNGKGRGIRMTSENSYTINRKADQTLYQLNKNKLRLHNNYLIKQEDAFTIKIYKYRKSGRHRLLYTMVKGQDNIYLYNRRNQGFSIELRERSILARGTNLKSTEFGLEAVNLSHNH